MAEGTTCIERTLRAKRELLADYRDAWCHHCQILSDSVSGDRRYADDDETIGSLKERYPCKGDRNSG